MGAKLPDVTKFCHSGFFQLCIYIKLIIVDAFFQGILKQVIQLRRIKTSKGNIKVSTLQVSNKKS